AIATDIEGHSVSLVDRRTSVNKDVPALQAYSHWNTQASAVTTEDLVDRLQQLGSTFEQDAARQIPIVESNTTSEALGMDGTRMFRFELSDQTPESAEFHLTVDRDVLITRAVLQDGDWSATFTPNRPQTAEVQSIVWEPIDVMPVDGIKQGIFLTSGQWTVRFQYAPAWPAWTTCLAGLGWISILGVILHLRKGRWANDHLAPDQAIVASSLDLHEH
ncbi:MAG: hypothetical protein ACR2NZ_03550, partial [Rubripirellula sp.]